METTDMKIYRSVKSNDKRLFICRQSKRGESPSFSFPPPVRIPLCLPLRKGDAQFPLCKRGIKGDSTALAITGGGHRG